MPLKTYIDTQVKDFLKKGTGNILFGLQSAPTYKLLPIYGAHESGSISSITSIEAVMIGQNASYSLGEKEIERITLSNSLIVFDTDSNQYIVDQDLILSTLLNNGIYYLEFKNGLNTFQTEGFLVQKQDIPYNWSMTVITWDSTLVTFDMTTLNI